MSTDQRVLNTEPAASDTQEEASISVLLLIVGIGIMVVGSVYPIVFTNASGEADHGIATALFWAMAAALVRGVGFIPRHVIFRWMFSGVMCFICIGIALAVRFL